MKNANYFIINKVFEKSQQFQILTRQLEMVLPVNLLNQFQVCGITEQEIKICVANASIHSLIRFHSRIIKKRCSEIFANRHIRIRFIVTPEYKSISKNDKKTRNRKLSAQGKEAIDSFCKQDIDEKLKAVLSRISQNSR